MPRLYRPHIPIEVRLTVAIRQLDNAGVTLEANPNEGTKSKLDRHLWVLFGDAKYHLDHDPALENRRKVRRKAGGEIIYYDPDANDPNYLIYREKHAHHIKTNVRGDHGQFPDNTIAKRERRRLKKKTPPPNAKVAKTWNLHPCMKCGRIHAKGKCLAPKRKWPSRPFPKRIKQ